MKLIFLVIGILLALVAVIFGAMGAHQLKRVLSPQQMSAFETAIDYQFYHALALILISITTNWIKNPFINYTGWCISVGTCLFSGSIYLLSCRELIGLSYYKWLGPITPIGGSVLIIAWSLFLVAVWKYKKETDVIV